MAHITLDGIPVTTSGELPPIGSRLIDFELVETDLKTMKLKDFKGRNLIFNIFPSVNTGVCSASVRSFNKMAASLENTIVLCISRDLPFTQKKFCAAEGIENLIMLSDYKTGAFGKNYGILMTNGIFDALLSRCIIVSNKEGIITYTQQVPDIGQEPNYKAALEALNNE